MRKRRFRLPSPALVISMITLSLVLGGTAFAASTAKHKDKKADIKLIKKLAPTLSVKHAKTADSATNATNATNATHATTADSATSATTASNANALGGSPPSAYQKSVRWAEIEGDGTIDAQSGGITVIHSFPGEYYVNFGTSVAGHALSATMEWRSGHGLDSGNILVGRCGGGTGGITCVAIGSDNTNTAYVQTDDNTNTNDDNRAFTVILYP
jgi:hypothetical protein